MMAHDSTAERINSRPISTSDHSLASPQHRDDVPQTLSVGRATGGLCFRTRPYLGKHSAFTVTSTTSSTCTTLQKN